MTATKKRIHARGICPVCGTSHKLQANGTMGSHPLNRYKPNGQRCSGHGQLAMRVTVGGTKATPKKTGQTYVAVLLDSSGSMDDLRDEAIAAFNTAVAPIREQGDDYHVSFYTFGEEAGWEAFPQRRTALKFSDRSPKSVPVLTRESYKPYGGTALNDALGEAIEGFKFMGGEDDSYLILIVTDGEELHSRNYLGNYAANRSNSQLANMVRSKTKTNRWTFALSCPGGYAEEWAKHTGFLPGNVHVWEQTKQGAKDMGEASGQAMRGYTTARDAGKTSVADFYEVVNVGRKSVDEVTAKLTPVSGTGRAGFRKITASKACAIKEAIESKGLTFFPGAGYYELTKPEKIQAHKKVVLELLQDGKGRCTLGPLYADNVEVREVLGIPVGSKGRIEPGNTGEWIVWVQSTSDNRKLLAKSRVLYRKS